MGFFNFGKKATIGNVLSSAARVVRVGQLFLDHNGNTCKATSLWRNSSGQITYVESTIVKAAKVRTLDPLDYHNGITR